MGTWGDEDSDESEGDGLDACEGVSPPARGRSAQETVLFERSVISESDIFHYFTHHPHPQTLPPGPTSRIQDHMSLSQDTDERPNLRVQTGEQRCRQANELRSLFKAHHHHSVLSPQLPTFSIGISPASPGFVVVPREPRRKTSRLSMESQTRRSQSEGDMFPVPDPIDEVVEHTLSEGANLQSSPPAQGLRWKLWGPT